MSMRLYDLYVLLIVRPRLEMLGQYSRNAWLVGVQALNAIGLQRALFMDVSASEEQTVYSIHRQSTQEPASPVKRIRETTPPKTVP